MSFSLPPARHCPYLHISAARDRIVGPPVWVDGVDGVKHRGHNACRPSIAACTEFGDSCLASAQPDDLMKASSMMKETASMYTW